MKKDTSLNRITRNCHGLWWLHLRVSPPHRASDLPSSSFRREVNGRSSTTVQVCLLRFWDARNVRRGGDCIGVDMLLLDSQNSDFSDSHLSHRPVHDCTSISGECFFIYRSNDSSKHQLRKRGGLNI
ncbi:hypothetical protein HID58_086132 [Brassica napus]|uniref:Uncharacterized protein n=1 Tax=Brassica napus TaxID=3708 RepID=A0ABQ7XPS7_BRANA|nr:hypothetical protein HID58_086132 [Brassica napus]